MLRQIWTGRQCKVGHTCYGLTAGARKRMLLASQAELSHLTSWSFWKVLPGCFFSSPWNSGRSVISSAKMQPAAQTSTPPPWWALPSSSSGARYLFHRSIRIGYQDLRSHASKIRPH